MYQQCNDHLMNRPISTAHCIAYQSYTSPLNASELDSHTQAHLMLVNLTVSVNKLDLELELA